MSNDKKSRPGALIGLIIFVAITALITENWFYAGIAGVIGGLIGTIAEKQILDKK